jgi:hypothetical protein
MMAVSILLRTTKDSTAEEAFMTATAQTNAEFTEIVERLRLQLDHISESLPEFTDDYHRLFNYFIGEHFEEVSPDRIKICDRQRDQKIDFYNSEEERFVAYQCKLPDMDLLETVKSPQSFGADLVNEAEDVLTFLTDETGVARGNKNAQEARNRYRSMKRTSEEAGSGFELEVVLAYFGRLTAPGEERLQELRSNWQSKSGEFKITTKDYDDIARELSLSLISRDRPSEITIPFKKDTVVHTNEWGYGLVPAITFFHLFEDYKMALFDLNVRYYLERSSVNKQIIRTLSEVKGQKMFHLLNNGITISCDGWKTPPVKTGESPNMKLANPQIINGCQTVISIYRAYLQIDDEYKQRNLETECVVPVRIIKTTNRDVLAEVVTASNNQNKMTQRNLKSNSRVQRVLQRKFAELKDPWFYERKDGEFDSIKEYPTRTLKAKSFQLGKITRRVSNDAVAKSWLSFIGLSTAASEQINAFESIDDGGRYEWLFDRRPNEQHWKAITLGPQVEFLDENFEAQPPTPAQYLLSYIIFEFAKAYLPSAQVNKKKCLERLRASKKITDSTSHEDMNKAMMDDDEYVLNQILSNMKEVIVELFSWIFVKTYGPVDSKTAKGILALNGPSSLYSNPDFKLFVKELSESNDSARLDNLLYVCMQFIIEGVRRWKSVFGREYLSSQRRIRFLHFPRTIEQIKDHLQRANEETKTFGYSWKPPDKTFLASLPELKT